MARNAFSWILLVALAFIVQATMPASSDDEVPGVEDTTTTPLPVLFLQEPCLHRLETKPLSEFEQQAVESFQESAEDIKVDMQDMQIQMVGALRASERCIACHGGHVGDLLGAFTYRLDRVEPTEEPKDRNREILLATVRQALSDFDPVQELLLNAP